MYFVLHLSKNLSPPPEKYILSDNKIRLLSPFEVLGSSSTMISLNLKNNLVSHIDFIDLKILRFLQCKSGSRKIGGH